MSIIYPIIDKEPVSVLLRRKQQNGAFKQHDNNDNYKQNLQNPPDVVKSESNGEPRHGITMLRDKNGPMGMPLSLEQLRAVFKMHDRNGDGRLDRSELKEAFRSLGALIPGWRADCALRNADANGDGYITEDEMASLVNYASTFGYTAK